MENKIELEVEFWQKVKYSGTVKVTQEQADALFEADGSDIDMYINTVNVNPVYELLHPLASDENIYEKESEFLDLYVEEKIDI